MAASLEGSTKHGPRGPAAEAARRDVSAPLCTDRGKECRLQRGKTPVEDASYGRTTMSELLESARNSGRRAKNWVPFRGLRASGSNGEGLDDGRRPNVLRSEDIEIYDGTKTNDLKLKHMAWYRHGLYKDVKFRRGHDGALELKPSSNRKNSSCRRRKDKGMLHPGIREASIRALVSILTGHIKQFLDDESFRESIRRSCVTCLGSNCGAEEMYDVHDGVVANLIELITSVENAVKKETDGKRLKKASLKLSMIADMNSKLQTNGILSGTPDSHLAACAHLYLSIIYVFQKKERASAKHILQVFCNAPSEARNVLLPALWNQLFSPHLSILELWHEKEMQYSSQATSSPRNMKLLQKVYGDALDRSTYKLAIYYKDWLTEETKSPLLPTIHVPSTSCAADQGELSSSGGSISSPLIVRGRLHHDVSSQFIVSRKLHQSVPDHENQITASIKTRIQEENATNEAEEKVSKECSDAAGIIDSSMKDYNTAAYTLSELQEHEDEYAVEYYGMIGSKRLNAHSNQVDRRQKPNCGIYEVDRPEANEHEYALSKLAQAIFELQPVDQNASNHSSPLKHLQNFEEFDKFIDNAAPEKLGCRESELKKPEPTFKNSQLISSATSNIRAEPSENYQDKIQCCTSSCTFNCPLGGQNFQDHVKLEIKHSTVPDTNNALRHLVGSWVTEHCQNIVSFASSMARYDTDRVHKHREESALDIISELLSGFSTEECMENARHLIAVGVLHFLVRRFELGSLEEKTQVVELLLCCIKADGCCRKYLAANLKGSCILELLHSKRLDARTNAVLLLIELICLRRTKDATLFLNGLPTEAINDTMHILLVYLQTSPPEVKVLVAVLLLYVDFMVNSNRKSIYKEQATDAITSTLECCSSDEQVIANCRRALLMLGGYFCISEVVSEDLLLQEAGLYNCTKLAHSDDMGDQIMQEEEEETKEKEGWQEEVTLALIGNGKMSFLDALSKCLSSDNRCLVKTCLTTVAWMSRALASISISESDLCAFSALIPGLKAIIEKSEQNEHRVFASISLYNFSMIPCEKTQFKEWRILLMTNSTELRKALKSLAEVSRIGKQLHAVLFGET